MEGLMQAWIHWMIYTVILCMPIYLPIGSAMMFIALPGWAKTFMKKVVGWTVVANLALALAPVVIAVALGYGAMMAWSVAKPIVQARRRQRRITRRVRPP